MHTHAENKMEGVSTYSSPQQTEVQVVCVYSCSTYVSWLWYPPLPHVCRYSSSNVIVVIYISCELRECVCCVMGVATM